MRTITTHQTNEANKAITITADERNPENGNASHEYEVSWFEESQDSGMSLDIIFQNGPIKENGINGLTNEVLLAIVMDRLEGFQSSKYACEENARALECIARGLDWLESRTRARESRGVEGTHKVHMSESGAFESKGPVERMADSVDRNVEHGGRLVEASEKATALLVAEAEERRRDVESAVAHREAVKTLHERAVVAEERKAVAFESIAQSLAVLAGRTQEVTNV